MAAAGVATGALAIAPTASASIEPATADSSPGAQGGLFLSAGSGPVGSVVQISGNAGPGCIAGNNWFGFDIAPVFPASGPLDQITPSVASDGSWTATFQIPSWMSGAADRGPGAATTPGQYLITAPTSCTAIPPPKAVASFTVTQGVLPSPDIDAWDAWVGIAATPDGGGYWITRANGAVLAFGDAHSFGSLTLRGIQVASPIVGIAATPDGRGYWLAGADGGVFAFGDARSYGSLPGMGITPEAPVVSIAPTANGRGYWLLGSDGGVFAFGDARFAGTTRGDFGVFNAIGSTGAGYSISEASFGALLRFPGGQNVGSGIGSPLAAGLSGAAFIRDGRGAWQVGLDGGVRTIGEAPFEGSLPGAGITPDAPIVGIAATPDGRGYWLLGSDGGVFSFGDAVFHGAATA